MDGPCVGSAEGLLDCRVGVLDGKYEEGTAEVELVGMRVVGPTVGG